MIKTSRGLDGTYKGGTGMDEATAPLRISELGDRVTLSVEEVALLLGLGRTAAYEAIRRGQIPSRKLGRRLIVPVPALLEWLSDVPLRY